MSQSKSKGHQAAIEPGKDGFSWCHQTDDPVQKCQLENSLTLGRIRFFFLPVLLFLFYFIFKLYIIVLVLPNIKMNPPQVYMCSSSFYVDLQLIGRSPLTLGRAIFFIQSTCLNVNFIQRHPHRNTQNKVWQNIQSPCDTVKMTHEINHLRSFLPQVMFSSPTPVCMPAQSLQSCLTLSSTVGCSPPGSSVHGILQEKILEWVAMPPPGDLPSLGIEPASLTSPAVGGGFFTTRATWEAPNTSSFLQSSVTPASRLTPSLYVRGMTVCRATVPLSLCPP